MCTPEYNFYLCTRDASTCFWHSVHADSFVKCLKQRRVCPAKEWQPSQQHLQNTHHFPVPCFRDFYLHSNDIMTMCTVSSLKNKSHLASRAFSMHTLESKLVDTLLQQCLKLCSLISRSTIKVPNNLSFHYIQNIIFIYMHNCSLPTVFFIFTNLSLQTSPPQSFFTWCSPSTPPCKATNIIRNTPTNIENVAA